MSRIGINVSWMAPRLAGGMEWYVRNLVEQLARLDRDNTYVLVTGPMNDDTFRAPAGWTKVVYDGPDSSPLSYRVSRGTPVPRAQRSLAYRVAQSAYRRLTGRPPVAPPVESGKVPGAAWRGTLAGLIAAQKLDLWFCPLIFALPIDTPVPIVVTIPDLQHESHPEFFSLDDLALRAMGYEHSCRSAAAVIGISEHVAGEIVQRYGVERRRVFGIPLALEHGYDVDDAAVERLANQVRLKYALEDGFVFYPANGWPHKNHERLVRALQRVREQVPGVQLVLTGSAGDLMERLAPVLRETGLTGAVRHLGYVDRDEVVGLYAAAGLLAFPSRFEGFGLPLLEAMRFDTPVACARIGSLPEVAGDAALYFDPTSVPEMADAITRLLTDAECRRALVENGRRRLPLFSYETNARRTLEVFQQVADGTLATPGLAPFRAPGPHGWLHEGLARWYFRAPALQSVSLELQQPLDLPELEGQAATVSLDGRVVAEVPVARGSTQTVTVQTPAPAETFHRLEVQARLSPRVTDYSFSLQVSRLRIRDGDRELPLA